MPGPIALTAVALLVVLVPIVGAAADLAIAAQPFQNGEATRDEPFVQTLAGSGGTATDYTWTLSAGALPPGLSLEASGTPTTSIHGTPTVTGAFLFTVTLTDSEGASTFRRYTIQVRLPPRYAVGVGDEFVDGQTELVVYDLTATPPTRHRILPNGAAWPSYADAQTIFEDCRFSPDGSKLAFVADIATDGNDALWVVDLSSGPQIGADFAAATVSTTALGGGLADVGEFVWSPDSRKVAYGGDLAVDGNTELYFTDVSNPAIPGPQVRISPPGTAALELVVLAEFGWAFSPDSNFVAFRGDFSVDGRDEVYATYVGPGAIFTPFSVNSPIPGISPTDEFNFFWWVPHHAGRLVYHGEQDTPGVAEIFMADVGASGVVSRVQLSGPMTVEGDASPEDTDHAPSPDGTAFFYIADEDVDTVDELYVVDVSGPIPGPAVKTSAPPVGRVESARWSHESTRIAYTDTSAGLNTLLIVHVDAPGAASQISPSMILDDVQIIQILVENPFATGSSTVGSPGASGFVFSPNGKKIAFVAGTESTANDVLYVSDLLSPGIVVSQVGTFPGADISSYAWAPDSSAIAYVGDFEINGVSELYHLDLTDFPAVPLPLKLNRTPVPASGDVFPASESVHFTGPERILYRADDRLDGAIEVVQVDFSDPAAITHEAVSTPALSSLHSVASLRIQFDYRSRSAAPVPLLPTTGLSALVLALVLAALGSLRTGAGARPGR
jgi:Tol biopolymer transport system component